MTLALHAENILKAWQSLDFNCLAAEIESAERTIGTEGPSSAFSSEDSELFAAVVGRLRSLVRLEAAPAAHRLETSFRLLRHLRDRPNAEPEVSSMLLAA